MQLYRPFQDPFNNLLSIVSYSHTWQYFRIENIDVMADHKLSIGIKEIDTTRMYGNNETDIGNAGGAKMGFIISTKNLGGWAMGRGTALLPENLLKTTHESLELLKVK